MARAAADDMSDASGDGLPSWAAVTVALLTTATASLVALLAALRDRRKARARRSPAPRALSLPPPAPPSAPACGEDCAVDRERLWEAIEVLHKRNIEQDREILLAKHDAQETRRGPR